MVRKGVEAFFFPSKNENLFLEITFSKVNIMSIFQIYIFYANEQNVESWNQDTLPFHMMDDLIVINHMRIISAAIFLLTYCHLRWNTFSKLKELLK